MRRYIWILCVILMSTAVYAAATSEVMKMNVYAGSSGEHRTQKVMTMLSGKVDEQGELQTLHVGTYLNQGEDQFTQEDLVLDEGETALEKISGLLAQYEGTIYLSLYPTSEQATHAVQVIYESLLKEDQVKANEKLDLKLAYTPLNEKDLGYKALPYIEAINVNMNNLKDQNKLQWLKSLKDYELLISDYMAQAYKESVAEGLDALSILYYDLAGDNIFVCSALDNLPTKYQSFYEDLQVAYQQMVKLDTSKSQTVALTTTTNSLQLLTRPIEADTPIEYVEYKVNEVSAGQSFRYPYVQTIDPKLLHEGINQVKVVMKIEGKNAYGVTSFYIDHQVTPIYEERAPRQEETYTLNQKPTYQKPYIPVLMYHKFKEVVPNTKEEQSMSVSTKLFESQLKALLTAGYTPINFKQLQQYLEGTGGLPSKPFIITADDGYLCNYEKAYPILKKYKAQATFFITSLYIGVENAHQHFTWEQAKEMEASGLIDIQSHTHRHALMNKLDELDVHYELTKSFGDIAYYLGERDVKVLAYPQFLHSKKTITWAQDCGVDLQITDLASTKSRHTNPTTALDIKRIHVSNDLSPQKLLTLIKGLTE